MTEPDDIQRYFSQLPGFNRLNANQQTRLLSRLMISYFKAGQQIPLDNDYWLCTLRRGAVELRDGTLFINRHSPGDLWSPSTHTLADAQLHVLEDAIVYAFSRTTLNELQLFDEQGLEGFVRSSSVVENTSIAPFYVAGSDTIADIMCENLVTVQAADSLQYVADRMNRYRVSSALIVDQQRLIGILTDRDLRSRVIAKAVPITSAVSGVMTRLPITIASGCSLFEAQHLMMRERIHHLPVVNDDVLVGIVTLNDFIRAQNTEPLFLVRSLHRAANEQALIDTAHLLPNLVTQLIQREASPEHIGKTITTVTDAITYRALDFAFEALGPAPCEFAWLAFGSQGRYEQMLGSDQDNALVLSDSATEADRHYFLELAKIVTRILNDAGIRYCPGDIMASNPKWCKTLSQWKRTFLGWIEQPEPKALMHSSIFFDMRHVCGQASLTDQLLDVALTAARENTIFLAMLAANAGGYQPPLGFFKSFVLERDGNHADQLDLKHRGTVPVVGMVRVLALANGIKQASTMARLDQLLEQQAVSRQEVGNLRDAHNFIAKLRLSKQGEAIQKGESVDNFVTPKHLSPLLRHQLKDAFKIVKETQKRLLSPFSKGFG